jgi:hypothetical protein
MDSQKMVSGQCLGDAQRLDGELGKPIRPKEENQPCPHRKRQGKYRKRVSKGLLLASAVQPREGSRHPRSHRHSLSWPRRRTLPRMLNIPAVGFSGSLGKCPSYRTRPRLRMQRPLLLREASFCHGAC